MRSHLPHPRPTWIDRFLLWVAVWDLHRGVRISVGSGRDTVRDAALTKLHLALDLLALHAPAQLDRIRAHMHGVFVGPIGGALATWRQGLRACIVEEGYVLDPATTPEDLASTLIHELTHARLSARGFGYEEPLRARVERICFLAERNWSSRLPPSPARTELEERVERYLKVPPERWSDAVRREERAAARRAQPLWLRAIGVGFRAVRAVERLTTSRSGAP